MVEWLIVELLGARLTIIFREGDSAHDSKKYATAGLWQVYRCLTRIGRDLY